MEKIDKNDDHKDQSRSNEFTTIKGNPNHETIYTSDIENILNHVTKRNNYGKMELKHENIKKELDAIINCFCGFFKEKGYTNHSTVRLNSGIDKTVFFIGAPISIFKTYITNGKIPENGFYISQPCIRTRNINTIFNDTIIPNRGSYFPGIITVTRYETLEKTCSDALEFLVKGLKIPLENIILRINKEDIDLWDTVNNLAQKPFLEVNSKPMNYYNHKYGMGDIIGKNFNLALRHKNTEQFNDIGNIIVIQDGNKKYGIEVALGATTIMSEMFHLDHIMGTSTISEIIHKNEGLYIKLKDCLVSSIAIMREGEKPNASNTKGRVVRTYLRGLLYLSKKLGLDNSDLKQYMYEYEKKEFGETTHTADSIIDYLKSYENELKSKQNNLRNEEILIKKLL